MRVQLTPSINFPLSGAVNQILPPWTNSFTVNVGQSSKLRSLFAAARRQSIEKKYWLKHKKNKIWCPNGVSLESMSGKTNSLFFHKEISKIWTAFRAAIAR